MLGVPVAEVKARVLRSAGPLKGGCLQGRPSEDCRSSTLPRAPETQSAREPSPSGTNRHETGDPVVSGQQLRRRGHTRSREGVT